MKIKSLGGEGATARDAVEALVFGLKDEQVGEGLTITVKPARIRAFGDDPEYDGFEASAELR